MPNRILKDSLCRSDSMARLSWFEQCLFTRLIVVADDYGRYDARPAIIKGSAFPLHEDVTGQDIQAALDRLAQVGMLELYTVDGKPYFQIISWARHQTVRNKRSKYPAPEEGTCAPDGTCAQMIADVPVIQSNPNQSNQDGIQSETESISESISQSISESESESNPGRTAGRGEDAEEEFRQFWNAYPRQIRRAEAREAFREADVPLAVLLSAVEAQKNGGEWARENGRFIPAPAKWLRDRRWEDGVGSLPGREEPAGDYLAGVRALRDALRREAVEE